MTASLSGQETDEERPEQRCNYMPVFSCNRGKSLQAASLDAVVLNGHRFKLRIEFLSVPQPHLCLLLLTAACIALGAVFVFVSLSLAA